MRSLVLRLLAWLLIAGAAATAGAADASSRLHYFAFKGTDVISSNKPDVPVNPASVVKVGTSLWALEKLGANHRYTTAFGTTADWDSETGVLEGDLVVYGGGDPDFQLENAFLVARELRRLGLRRVEGSLRVVGTFWCGWEKGMQYRQTDPVKRGELMGRRLRAAFDTRRWSRSTESAWRAMATRRGWNVRDRVRIAITGGVEVAVPNGFEPLVVHRSNRLADLLRRFNVYSNNDIIRVAEGIGEVAEMEAFVTERLQAEPGQIELSTASGELRNRMSVRLMTRLLTELAYEAVEQDIELRYLLPSIGCDPGHTRKMFPSLARAPLTGTVTCKTGTLTHTDGGVAVLAGTFAAADGEPVVFAIAAPRAGRSLQYWRMLEQRWVLALMEEQGGAIAVPCGKGLPFSDTFAEIDVILAEVPSVEK